MKMKLFLFLSVTSTLVFGEIINDIHVPKNNTPPPITDNAPTDEATTDEAPTDGAPTDGAIFGWPKECPKNMELHPLMSEDYEVVAWRCECKPAFLRLTPRGPCYEAYREGPCPAGKFVKRAKNSTLGECVKNQCTLDGFVFHNGSCYALGANDGICSSRNTLGVNETTFRVECIEISPRKLVSNQHVNVVDAPERNRKRLPCPPGMGRATNGACLRIWDDEEESPRKAARRPGNK